MSNAAANETRPAILDALRAAGARLASSNVRGRFHLACRPGRCPVVTFAAAQPDSIAIDVEALVQAVIALRAAGFEAERFGSDCVHVRAAALSLAA